MAEPYAIADQDSLVPGAALVPLTKDVSLGQLAEELEAALHVADIPLVETESTLYVGPLTEAWPLAPDAVEAVIAAHTPVRHYFYTDDEKYLHDIYVKINQGIALSTAEQADQFRVMMAVTSGALPACDCTTPLAS